MIHTAPETSVCVARLVPLDASHEVDSFECAHRDLRDYLRHRALADQNSAKLRVYVLARGRRVVAYCCLACGVVEAAVSRDGVLGRERRRIVPVIVIVRMAVDRASGGSDTGRCVLDWVRRKGAQAAGVVGAQAVVATATGDETRSFFQQSGFMPLPGDPYRLYRPLAAPSDARSRGGARGR